MRKNEQGAGDTRGNGKKRQAGMFRILKAVIVLVIIGFIGLTGYAFLGDLTPTQSETVIPVTLDAN